MNGAAFACFGDRQTFAIEARLVDDPHRDATPIDDAWSFGEWRIFVRNRCLTRHAAPGGIRDEIHWYLAPLLRWLNRVWLPLMHEQRPPASLGTHEHFIVRFEQGERLLIDDESQEGSARRSDMQAWRRRHSLWTASAGGVIPNIWFRRQSDLCEISYDPGTIVGAPRAFEFQFARGAALIDVGAVGEALSAFLRWGATAGATAGVEISVPDETTEATMQAERWLLGDRLTRFLSDAEVGPPRLSAGLIYPSSPEVAMFGTLTPELSMADARLLLDALGQARSDEAEHAELMSLTAPLPPATRETSWEQGYGLALQTLEALGLGSASRFIDIERILVELGVDVRSTAVGDPSLRGVAIAGEGFRPTVIVNDHARWNRSSGGRRFTLAHEFCHILADRGSARRVTHSSTPWAPEAVERRANAFAAMFLMPYRAVDAALAHIGRISDVESLRHVAARLKCGKTAVLEHLNNIDRIDPGVFFGIKAGMVSA